MIELLKRNIFYLLLAFGIILFLFLPKDDVDESNTLVNIDNSEEVLLEEMPDLKQEKLPEEVIIVDVKGEINAPGIYEVRPDARIYDVVQQAGGLTPDANENEVNFAQKVQDEMIIFIPKKGENMPEVQISSTSDGKVRINYATKEEIQTLNGIGPSKADAIIQHREEQGLFQTMEDLLQVSGIGEKTLENIKEDIQIP